MKRNHESKLRRIIADATKHLLDKRESKGHWEDIRKTSLVVLTFKEVLKEDNVSDSNKGILNDIIKDAEVWIASQSVREEFGVSWNSEVWDTSLALMAISSNKYFKDKVDLGISYLKKNQSASNGSWYEEAWETMLTVISVLNFSKNLNRAHFNDLYWLNRAVDWLIDVPSRKNGLFISPQYSGILVWLYSEIVTIGIKDKISNFEELENKVKVAIKWCTNILQQEDKGGIWSEYVFSNAYVLYGLTRYMRLFPIESDLSFDKIIEWFEFYQSNEGAYEDVQDTALSILGLSSLIEFLEIDKLYLELTKEMTEKKLIGFLGFCGKSKTLASHFKELLRHHIPNLIIKDWIWDFNYGKIIINEIQRMSEECDIAIFLVTRDDMIINNEATEQPAPRDNVIFEVGYFAAKYGIENTIIIVENGTKLPADWGGIIYYSFNTSNDFANVILSLRRHLKLI